MRVIAGSARRLNLITPKGFDTRPTTDKSKETLFNCLMPYIADASFLDIFSGSGGIGIEALSRGAKRAVFLENSKEALACIEKNLKTTHFEDIGEVYKGDAFASLKMLEARGPFDIIFMDPPFNKGLEESVLKYLVSSRLISDDTIIVVEASNETSFDYVSDLGFEIFKLKQYKNNRHLFLRKA